MLGLAGLTAAAAPTYVFAPIGGWRSDVIANPLFPVRDQAALCALLARPDVRPSALNEDLERLGLKLRITERAFDLAGRPQVQRLRRDEGWFLRAAETLYGPEREGILR